MSGRARHDSCRRAKVTGLGSTASERVEQALGELQSAGKAPLGWKPCTSADLLAAVERANGGPLPLAYRWFLQLAGRSSELFTPGTHVEPGLRVIVINPAERSSPQLVFTGSDIYWPWPLRLRQDTDGLLAENDLRALTPSETPFLMHQGYQAFWMADGSDDPEVVRFVEGDTPAPERTGLTFTEWLVAAA